MMQTASMNKPLQITRISVPVTPEVLEKFRRFSEASGLSLGKSIGGWLRDTVAGLDAMTEILETHKRAPAQAMAKLQGLATSIQLVADDAVQNMRGGPSPGGEGAPLAGKSLDLARAAMAKAAQSPRLVIRGVKSQPKGKRS